MINFLVHNSIACNEMFLDTGVRCIDTIGMASTEVEFTNIHVDVTSAKQFMQVVKDLRAELGKASTEMLMDKLSASKTFAEFVEEIEPLAGRSNLIEVGALNWGKVMSRVPIEMKAQHIIIGNPLTARKLLEAGGPQVGLYLPTKMYVYEDSAGISHVSYDRLSPALARFNNDAVNTIAGVIDGILARLCTSAVG
jgi:uncharacterized protein (DUF302 family)